MDFKFRRADTQKQYNYVFPTSSPPSSLNYTYFSDQAMIHGLCTGRNIVPVRESVGFPPSLMVGQPLRNHRQFEPVMPLHREPFSPYDLTFSMPFEERYGGSRHHDGDVREFEAAAFRRLLPSPTIKEITTIYQPQDLKKEIILLGKPINATASGLKRKVPSPSSPTVAAGSSGFGSKKPTEEWRCAVCDISATCERGLKDHLAGKKHVAKVESLKGNNTDIGLGVKKQSRSEIKCLKGEIGLGVIKNSHVKKQKSDSKKVVKMRKKLKFWCKICKTGAHDEIVMREHKNGKKHMKNRRVIIKARAKKREMEDRKGCVSGTTSGVSFVGGGTIGLACSWEGKFE